MITNIPNFKGFSVKPCNEELMVGIPEFPSLDERALLWVSCGVYFGYPEEEIVRFYDQISNLRRAPKGTPFAGTGYIYAGKALKSKAEHVAEINNRRYHPKPFPDDETSNSDMTRFSTIKMLLNCDQEFRCSVWDILVKLENKYAVV
jgi:hypothetical protein